VNILHTVELYSPSVGGAQEVVKQISERLVARGHQVTVATTKLANRTSRSLNGVRVEEFGVSGNAVRGYRGERRRYQEFLIESNFDIMMNYAAQQWTADLAFPILDRIRYRKILAPCGFSALSYEQYRHYFENIPDVLRKYDQLIFHSNTYQDTQFAREHKIGHFVVIPNGASEEEFGVVDSSFRRRYGIGDDVPLLLTVGSHTGVKGHRTAIDAFIRARIGPSVLVIVGNTVLGQGCLNECLKLARRVRALSLGKKRVLVIDPVRADVVAAYHSANLFLLCSNIECSPIVLFEAMASRTPFVSSACGNAEEIAEWSNGGLIVPSMRRPDGFTTAEPAAVARRIEEVLSNLQKRCSLADAGYLAWRSKYTWDKITVQYEAAYQRAMGVN
jgi:L-malate glycosyltransferase